MDVEDGSKWYVWHIKDGSCTITRKIVSHHSISLHEIEEMLKPYEYVDICHTLLGEMECNITVVKE